jgi:hypothetical protein
MLAVSLPGVLFVVVITAACLGLISWLLAGSRVTVARRADAADPPATASARDGSGDAASVIDLRAPTPDAMPERRDR